MTVDQYIDFCSSYIGPFAATGAPPGITNGQLSEVIGNFHMLFSDLEPPVEIEEWHDVQLDIWQAMRDAISQQPAGEQLNPIVLLEAVFGNFEAMMSVDIDPELVERLNAAGCTGNFVDLEEVPDDQSMIDESQPEAETSDDVLAEVHAYAAGCAGLAEESAGPPEGVTYGETADGVGMIIEQLRELMPPEVVSDWHNAQIALFESIKEIADAEPADAPLEQTKLFGIIPQFQAVNATIADMPADVQGILVESACIAQ